MPAIIDAGDVLPLLPRHAARTIAVMDVDGKRSAARNAVSIATSCAQGGERTLLLDCDTQHASCGKLLGLRPSMGLAGLLAPGKPRGDLGQELRDDRMASVLEELRADYDCVVAALPSPLSSDGALMLADMLGMVFLSISSERTKQSAVAEIQRRLRLANIQMTGFLYGSPRGRIGRRRPWRH